MQLTYIHLNLCALPLTILRRIHCISHLESKLGRQIGVQLSAALKDSEEETRLKMRCKSDACRLYFFIRTIVTSWLSAIRMANTRF